ncbi:MAG TPA: hypothetical protein VHX68_20640 [Planctomycetaceae bacterium]|jgi:hypothetical protein|nr:hypothetical protein [Planctomycetaceae bacterium]
MTGYTVHTGSNVKYSTGWDNVFSGPPRKTKAAAKKKPAKKKPAKKKSAPRKKKGR